MTDLEERLHAEFVRRAEAGSERPRTPVRVVRARALRLRRRAQASTAALVVVAVLLVVLPLAVLVTRTPGDSSPQPAPAPTSPAPSTDATPDRLTTYERLAQLPVGPAPRIEYQAGHQLVLPDGTERESGRLTLMSAFVHFGYGYLGLTPNAFEGTQGLVTLDGQLQRVGSACAFSHPPALSADRGWVWWGTSFCPETGTTNPVVLHNAPATNLELQTDMTLATAEDEAYLSVLGPVDTISGPNAEVAYSLVQGGITSSQAPPQVIVTGPDGERTLPLDAGLDASTSGLVAGEVDDDLVVIEASSGDELWRIRKQSYGASFSPGGKYLVDSKGTVYDAQTGREITRTESGFQFGGPVWEDNEHLLVAIRGKGREMAVLRYDLTGNAEVAVDWRDAVADGQANIGFEVLQ